MTPEVRKANSGASTGLLNSEDNRTEVRLLKFQETVQQQSQHKVKKADSLSSRQKSEAGTSAESRKNDSASSFINKNTDRSKKGKVKNDRLKKGKQRDKEVSSPSTPSKSVLILPSSPISADDSTGSTGIRPPPGLLPPPGFGSASNSPLRSPTVFSFDDGRSTTLSSEAISGNNLYVPQYPRSGSTTAVLDRGSLPEIVARNVSDLSVTHIEPLLGQNERGSHLGAGLSSSEEHTVQTDYTRAMDFDVMDFLDGILDEGNTSTAADNIGGLISKVAAAPTTPSFPSPALSSNPWAMDSSEGNMASRASAYGIAVEEISEQSLDSETMSMPLLTPAAIFSSDHEEKDDAESNSFYTNLPK
jgi:hypothetical protein